MSQDPAVPTPTSVIDPYAKEPSETKHVCCVLHYTDGRTDIRVTDARVLGEHTLLRIGASIFDYRGDNEIMLDGKRPRWCKIFRECKVVEIE